MDVSPTTIMIITELNVKRLTATLSSNFVARYEQAKARYNCNQGHEWIEHNHMFKTSLLKYPNISMELTIASSLHGNKITAGKRFSKILSP